MAQLKITKDNFNLVCKLTCRTQEIYEWSASEGSGALIDTQYNISDYPDTVSHTVSFDVNVPNGATITGARVYATLGSPLFGAHTSKINGVSVETGATVSVDVAIADGATTVDVPFQFLCYTPSHAHEPSGVFPDSLQHIGSFEYRNFYFNHESSLNCSDVYLLIDYKPAIEFTGWTDDPLVVGETFVKAVHMTELQQWASVLSEYADNGTPSFTEAVSGETSLARWLSQVQELRAVMDVVSPSHEPWINVSVNCPRADVMTQLREIIVAAM